MSEIYINLVHPKKERRAIKFDIYSNRIEVSTVFNKNGRPYSECDGFDQANDTLEWAFKNGYTAYISTRA